MEFLDLVKKRHSARVYEDRQIPDEDIKYILEAARFAPTAFNVQQFKLKVIKDKEKIAQIAKAAEAPFVERAPIVVVAIGLNTDNKYNPLDVAIVLDHLQLAAAEKEIGSCWVGTMGHGAVDELFDLPQKSKVYAVMPLGYDAGKILPKKRKEFNELFEIEG